MLDSFGTDTIRVVFAFLDRLVYSLVGTVYGFIKDLASFQVFTNEDFSRFSSKMYGIIGIFMLFKVSFSLLTYIVNPDTMSDKEKGAGTIAKNIIIVLMLIILSPFAFSELTKAQKLILDEGVLERFVFGVSSGSSNSIRDRKFQMNHEICENRYAKAASDGDYVALQIFKGFYQPEWTYLDVGYTMDQLKEQLTGSGKAHKYCQRAINANDTVTVSDYLQYSVYNDADPGSGDTDYYTVNYIFLWSTIVGVVTLLLFINLCLEIAKRSIKLGFLQIIAPIPIMSFVDPKSGKDGLFKKWLKQVGSTWASLFVRLIAIYMSIFLIQMVCTRIADEKLWMKIFIIIGCLMFAKELPKLIEQLVPGLNMSGKFSLNPIKNFRENSVGSKYVSAAGAWAVGTAGGIVANSVNAYKNRNKMTKGQIARSVIAGGAAGGFYSMQNGYRNDRIFSSALSGTNGGVRRSGENRNTRAQFAEEGKTWGPTDKLKDWFTDVTATRTETGTTSFIKNEINDSLRRIEDYMRDEAIASRALNDIMASDNGTRFSVFNELINQTSPSQYTKDHGIEYFYQYNAGDYSNYYNNKMSHISNENEYQNLSAKLQQLSQQLQIDKASYDQAVQSGASDNVTRSYEVRYKETEAKQREVQVEFDNYMKSKMVSESEFNSIISARTARDTANSNQNKEKFRKESLEKRQKSMKPTSNKK